MRTTTSLRVTNLALGTLLVGLAGVQAVGFRLPNQDPDAIARGNAFVATADNPAAIYYNPAGITQLQGHNVRAGLYMVRGGIEYESPTGMAYDADSEFLFVPQLYYVFSPKESPLSLGMGFYAPYGLSLDWGENAPFRTTAQKGELNYLTINPVLAYRIHPTLSVGIGPTFNYSDATFKRGLGLLPGDLFILEGDGWACGFNAGLRWQPHEKWAFGLNYRHLTTVDYKGTVETTPSPPLLPPQSGSASIRFPQFVVAGVSFRPTEDWNLEFNIDWTDWDDVDQIPIQSLFINQIWPLNYKSSFMYEFGVTRKLPKDFFVSVGYFYSENSSPDQDYNPIIPDSALHLGSIGVGQKRARWEWTIAYHFGYNPGHEVTGATTFPDANGTYRILNHAINIAAGFKF